MYSIDTKVRFSDCNHKKTISVGALINIIQDCVNYQSEETGPTFKDLERMNKVWLMNNYHIVIDRMPTFYENIRVSTWPYAFKGFFGMRNFTIEDEKGNNCVSVDSTWIMYDTEKKRVVKAPEELINMYQLEPACPMNYEGRKLTVEGEEVLYKTVDIDRHHMDINGHMNNAWYVVEAGDCLEDNFEVKEIRVEYKVQTFYKEKLYLYRVVTEDSVTVAMKGEDGVIHAIVKFDGKTVEE